MHSILFGESGNGKSWLYKKALNQYGYHFKIANCANASRLKSLTNEIVNATTPSGTSRKVAYTEAKEAGIRAVVADGRLSYQGQFEIQNDEPLLAALKKFRNSIGNGDAILVIDNLESIFGDSNLMSELADIIILLDDPRYAETRIKFLIVGVPNGVLEYFARTKNLESVSNRLRELPKVGGMTAPMVRTLVETGFNNLLKFNLNDAAIAEIASHVHHCTMGVAQRVQEYCEILAYKISDDRVGYSRNLLDSADKEWLHIGFREAYTVIESHLNSKKTTIARRNQVIYCIGRITSHQLDTTKVATKIRQEFPETANDTDMGIGAILSDLATGSPALLKKNPNTKDYVVADPRYIMCIRTMLRKENNGTVTKLAFAY